MAIQFWTTPIDYSKFDKKKVNTLLENVKKKQNLFDFSTVKSPATFTVKQTTNKWTVDNQITNNLVNQGKLPESQREIYPQTAQNPVKSTQEKDIIQSFLDDETQDYENRATVFQMLQDNVPRDVIDKAIRENTGYTWPKVWLIEKLWQRVKDMWQGISDIQKAPIRFAVDPLTQKKQMINVLWPIAGWVNDVIWAGVQWVWSKVIKPLIEVDKKIIKAITPEIIQNVAEQDWKVAKEVWSSILESKVWQAGLEAVAGGMEKYQKWAEENPEDSRLLNNTVNIASLIPIGKSWQVAKEWIENVWEGVVKWVIKAGEKAKDFVTPTPRDISQVSANILQPTNRLAEKLPTATKWIQRIVWEKWVSKTEDYTTLLKKADTTVQDFETKLTKELSSIKWTRKSQSANNALEQLSDIYSGSKSSEFASKLKRAEELRLKNINDGLSALELQEVKRLHTSANKLFNDLWPTKWITKEDLQALRNDLKIDIEDFADSQWITNVRDLNKAYWEVLDAKTLLKKQQLKVKSFEWRQLPTTLSQKIWELIWSIPIIKWGLQGILKQAWISIKAGKIDPIQVQARLPKLLKELQKAGMKAPELKKFEVELWKQLALPYKSLVPENKPARITPQTLEKARIQESKVELKNAKIGTQQPLKKSEVPKLLKKEPKVLNTWDVRTDTSAKISSWYKESAKNRFKEWDFTTTEIRKWYEKLNSLYEGRIVEFQNGTKWKIVSKPAFWKVKIKYEDWKIVNEITENIYRNQKQASLEQVKEYLKGTEYKWYSLKSNPLSNNSWFINPTAIAKDIKKLLPKKIEAPKELIEEAKDKIKWLASDGLIDYIVEQKVYENNVNKYQQIIDNLKLKYPSKMWWISDEWRATNIYKENYPKMMQEFKKLQDFNSNPINKKLSKDFNRKVWIVERQKIIRELKQIWEQANK